MKLKQNFIFIIVIGTLIASCNSKDEVKISTNSLEFENNTPAADNSITQKLNQNRQFIQAQKSLLNGDDTYDMTYAGNRLVVTLKPLENDIYKSVVTHQLNGGDISSRIDYFAKSDLLNDNVALCGPIFCLHIATLKVFDIESGNDLTTQTTRQIKKLNLFNYKEDTIDLIHYRVLETGIDDNQMVNDYSENQFYKFKKDSKEYYIGLKGPLIETCRLSPSTSPSTSPSFIVEYLDQSSRANSTYDNSGNLKSIFFFSIALKELFNNNTMNVLNIKSNGADAIGSLNFEITSEADPGLKTCTSFWDTMNSSAFYTSTQLYTLENQTLRDIAGSKLNDPNVILPKKLIPNVGKNNFVDFVSKNAYSEVSLASYLASSNIQAAVIALQPIYPELPSKLKDSAEKLANAQVNSNILISNIGQMGGELNKINVAINNANLNIENSVVITSKSFISNSDSLKNVLDIQSQLSDTYSQFMVAKNSYNKLTELIENSKVKYQDIKNDLISVQSVILELEGIISTIKPESVSQLTPIKDQIKSFLELTETYYESIPSGISDGSSEIMLDIKNITNSLTTAETALNSLNLPIVGVGDKFTCSLVFPALPTPISSKLFCWGDVPSDMINVTSTTYPVAFPVEITPSLLNPGSAKNLAVGDKSICLSAPSLTSPKTSCIGEIVQNKTNAQSGWKSFNDSYKNLTLGKKTACGINDLGDVFCWGDLSFLLSSNISSEETSTPTFTPAPISGFTDKVVKLALGSNVLCGVLENSTVQCLGKNDLGQLGNKSNVVSSTTSVSVVLSNNENLGGVVNISAKDSLVCAATASTLSSQLPKPATTYCWGGISSDNKSNVAVNLSNTGTRVAVGPGLFCNVDDFSPSIANHKSFCYGVNFSSAESIILDVKENFLSSIYSMDVGKNTLLTNPSGTYCVTLLDGSIWCWGGNDVGQLGNGNAENSTTPIKILGPTNSASTDCSYWPIATQWDLGKCGY